jgi:hypothetical protein
MCLSAFVTAKQLDAALAPNRLWIICADLFAAFALADLQPIPVIFEPVGDLLSDLHLTSFAPPGEGTPAALGTSSSNGLSLGIAW